VNLIEMKNSGMKNLLENYTKFIQSQRNSEDFKLNLIQENQNFHYFENQSKSLGFYSLPLISETQKTYILKTHSFRMISLSSEAVLLQIDNSSEISANYIRDEINVYKNHYLEFIFQNKNQLDILTNIKYLKEFFLSEVAESIRDFTGSLNSSQQSFALTKIINISPKYLIINKSSLNLIITQDQCFEEGFLIIHPHAKQIFRWINFEKPFLAKLKMNDSFFTKPFPLDSIGEYKLNLKNPVFNSIVKVSVIEHLGTTLIYIEETTQEPLLYIENLSNVIIKVAEKSVNSQNYMVLNPLMSNPFCLDDNSNQLEVSLSINFLGICL
jgi:hypothetical protein